MDHLCGVKLTQGEVLRILSSRGPAVIISRSSTTSERSAPSAGHAATTFHGKLWVVGGRSEQYQTYNLQNQHRRGDVWSSTDGASWQQSDDLTGDFYLQNFDAVNPGPLAPWYARFGHTLDTINVTGSNGALIEYMVLTGGYTPDPDNDVWVTADGSE